MSRMESPCSLSRPIFIRAYLTLGILRSRKEQRVALDISPPDRVPSEAEIQDLERQLGFRLPDRFRALLPQLNVAQAEPNVIKGPGDEDYGISRFKNIEHIAQSKNAMDSGNPSDLLLVPFADNGMR